MRFHCKNKFKEKYDNILWESFTFACQNGNPKKGILKMIHNIAPTQITLHRKHFSHDALCPICREQEEIISHILRCNGTNGVLKQHFFTILNKKLKGKTDKLKTVINDIYESIVDKSTGSMQAINWEIQQYIGWDCCIRGILLTEWLAVSRLMNVEKLDSEIIGWIIIMLWKTWNEAWKARNKKFKKNQYIAQAANMQRIEDIDIIYHCREYLPDHLNSQLKSIIKEHLSQSNVLIDE
jgi:hypothetical protein